MSYVARSNAVAGLLLSVADVGLVHPADKYMRDRDVMWDLARENGLGEPYGNDIRFWLVTREAVSESVVEVNQSNVTERWRLTGFDAIQSDSKASWAAWRRVVRAVEDRWRETATATLAPFDMVEGLEITLDGWGYIGQVLCHVTRLEFDAHSCEILDQVIDKPVHVDSSATGRDDTWAVGDQIVGYMLDAIDSGAHVRQYHEHSTSRREGAAEWRLDVGGGDAVRAWEITIDSDLEERGHDSAVTADTIWRLRGFWSWDDADNSYLKFQQHIDDLRVPFRHVGNIGDTRNYTRSFSSPLQFGSSERFHLGDGTFCHSAEATLRTREYIYA